MARAKATDNGTGVSTQPEISRENVNDKIDLILFPTGRPYDVSLEMDPDNRQRTTYTIGLVPMPIKYSRAIKAMLDSLQDDAKNLDLNEEKVSDVMIEIAAYMLHYYGIEKATKEVVEASLPTYQIQELIEIQLELQREDDFLLQLLPTIFAFLKVANQKRREIATRIAEKSIEVPTETATPTESASPSPMSPSVNPGESPSTNLSDDTPTDNLLS